MKKNSPRIMSFGSIYCFPFINANCPCASRKKRKKRSKVQIAIKYSILRIFFKIQIGIETRLKLRKYQFSEEISDLEQGMTTSQNTLK